MWSWTRASWRRDGPTLIGLVLLVGLIGGIGLFAAAGARRTQSAYPRFLRSTNPSTMVVDVGGLDSDGYTALHAIAALPQVEVARAYTGFYVAPWVDGHPDLSQDFEAIASMDGRYFVQDRFTAIKGRLPNPERADEVAVNEETARRYGYRVGQKIDLATVSRADVESPDSDPADVKPRLLTHATIVGIGTFIEEVLQDDTDRSPLMLLTPAFYRAAKGLETYAWDGLILRRGDADVPAVQQAIAQASGGADIFRQTSNDTFHALQAVRPVSLALAVFALIAASACVVLTAQALTRQVRAQRETSEVARAIGVQPTGVAALTMGGPVIALIAGAVLAAVLSVMASPAMPIGRVRRVEVDRGMQIDWTVIAVGVALYVLSGLVVLGIGALRQARHRRLRSAPAPARARFGRVVEAANLPPAVAVGAHFSFGASHRAPVRSVVASTVVAVAALVAAATFGVSMRELVSHPHLFGWNWDVALVDSSGYGNTDPTETPKVLGSDPDVQSWSGAFFGSTQLGTVSVPLLGMEPDSDPAPPLHSGRMVQRRGEIVLGTKTMEQLDAAIGDTVTGPAGSFTVVGSATLPSLGVVHGAHTSLGVGAIVVTQDVPGWDRNMVGPWGGSIPPEQYGPNVLFVRFRSGVDHAKAIARLETTAQQFADYSGVVVAPVQRPAEIVNANNITGSSSLLAFAVAVASLASFGVAVGALIRRRRRDIALLRAIGFSGRQVTTAVSGASTAIAVVGLVVGVPLGAVVGRMLWNAFADQLDVLARPVFPTLAVAVTIVLGLVAAVCFAAFAARRARTIPAASVLRGE